MRARTGAALLALIVALGTPLPAHADENQGAAAKAAVAWLDSTTLPSGLVPSSEDFGDLSITLDAVLAAAAAGSPEPVQRWLDGVSPLMAERVAFDVGALGKALVAVDAVGRDSTSFAGQDLQQLALDATQQGQVPGWAAVAEVPEGGNAFAQSLIMIGLARTHDLPPATVEFLAGQQCADGGFPMFFKAEGCGDAVSDPDGTALVVMALKSAQAECITSADDTLTRATTWLLSQQQPSGAFLGAAPWTAIENTNSTGVIAGALAPDYADSADKAAAWVTGMQIPVGRPGAGSIYYDETNRTTDPAVGTWQRVRSTPQAVLALTREGYHTLQLMGTASSGGPQPCAAALLTGVGMPPTGD